MQTIKKLLRLFSLSILISLALLGFGMGGAGSVFSTSRERHTDNGIKTEWVRGKKEEANREEKKDKN